MAAETKPAKLAPEKPQQLQLKIEEGEAEIRFLVIPEIKKKIPIYDFRNLIHQVLIAKAIANEAKMAMFGGVWGGFKGVKRATVGERFFERAKPGRPKEAKIPLLTSPEDGIKICDWQQVHPDFRYLQDYWNFKKLWEGHGAFLHIIAPVRSTLETLPEIFKTTPSEFAKRYPNLEPIPVTTAALIWREEPYMRHFANLVKRFSHTQIYVGVSTLNPHGEEPPYTTSELFEDIKTARCQVEEIDLIVQDKLYEESGAFASHTQLRLPLVGETPTLKVLRIGSLSPEGFKKATGFKVESPAPGTKDVRKVPGVSLDDKLAQMFKDNNRDWKAENPQIYFRN